jgi:hypothetical protein
MAVRTTGYVSRMTTDPKDQGVGGTAAGPDVPREDALHAEAEEIAVPRFDVVSVPLEGLMEAAEDLIPDIDEPRPDDPEATARPT